MPRRPRRNVHQKMLPGFSPVPAVGKAVVVRNANLRPDPAVQLPLPPSSDQFRQHALTIAQACTEHVKAILKDLITRIEALADDAEKSCPDSERVKELRDVSAAIGHLFDDVAGIAWPHVSGRESRRLQLINPPSADRHPRKCSSKKEVAIAELRAELNTAIGFLDSALLGLSQFKDDAEIAELLKELGEIKQAAMLSGVGVTRP